jgi:hypothetical protein
MREILFRGKTIPECIGWNDEKEEEILSESKWIHGGYGEIYGSSYIMTPPFMKHITAGGSRWMDEEIEAIRVLPETIGQYIGKDSRNDFLFTGDIIRTMTLIDFPLYKESYGWEMYNAEVIMEKGCYKASFTRLNKTIALYELKRFKSIGNVHDNPELLEELK